jgi:hypothetical protein
VLKLILDLLWRQPHELFHAFANGLFV